MKKENKINNRKKLNLNVKIIKNYKNNFNERQY